MFGTLKGRIATILIVLAVSSYYLATNKLKLGLDLKGGMHLALEVADSAGTMNAQAKADATDRALQVIRNRVDQFGTQEPLIQKVGDERIVVELPGDTSPARAKAIIEQTAYLQFLLVKEGNELQGSLPRLDRAVVQAVPAAARDTAGSGSAQRPDELNQLIFGQRDTAAADSAARAAGDTTRAVASADTAAPPATGAGTARPLSSRLLDSGLPGEYMVAEGDVETVNRYLGLPEVRRALPRNTQLLWADEPEGRGAQLYRRLYILETDPFVTGDLLEDAQAGRDQQFGQTIVTFEFNRRGGRTFERVTSQHIGDRIAIVLDNRVYSAPTVQSTIGSRGQIEMGQAPLEEAQDLALVLRAGALPVPIQIVEERTVGPTLGADSVVQGRNAGIIGIILVVAIMIFFYRLAGVFAVIALAAYCVVVLGGLAAFNATLTAPGIAGFILSIGMGVDGNVLIFERIREELAVGRTPRAAVDAGFREAMSAIIDTHITTLITALILYNVGTGPVQGFAVTLAVGIIASFFSSVFVTRTLFLLYLQRGSAPQTVSI